MRWMDVWTKKGREKVITTTSLLLCHFHFQHSTVVIMKTPDYYPVEARVVLKGLVKAPELNGKVGIVKSGLTNGRQHVLVEELNKSVALKVSNLSYEPRSVDSLSVKELKKILKSKASISDSELTGVDKSELQSKVSALDGASSPETIGQWLAEEAVPKSFTAATKTPSSTSSSAAVDPSLDPAQAADQLANMNPEQLRQQARMMRSMPPDQIRRMNPQLAHMTDAQILAAASQMEMMASNPAMMKMASEQIKNMSPEDIRRAQMAAGGGAAAASGPRSTTASSSSNRSTGTPMPAAPGTAAEAAKAAEMMANMTPEQLRQQADMFESMSPDAIRQMNPQVAHMTDDQIKMAATQFRMMADNPDMMKMVMDQMKNMTPEEIEAMKNGGADPAKMMAGDPSKMLASMDKEQLKSMLKTVKENPEMLKQFAASSGLGEEQLAKGMEMFADMDDDKLDMAVNLMQKAQKAKDLWTNVDNKTGGHLIKILVAGSVLFVALVVYLLFFRSSGGGVPVMPVATEEIPNLSVKQTVEEDEFATEF